MKSTSSSTFLLFFNNFLIGTTFIITFFLCVSVTLTSVSAATSCSTPLQSSITPNNTCTYTPTFTINNFLDLASFEFQTVDGKDASINYQYINYQLVAYIESEVNYIFKYQFKGCDTPQTLPFRVNSIHLNITQPNCIHSSGYVDIVNSDATSFYIDGVLQTGERPFRALPGLHTFYAVNPISLKSCTMDFLIEESNVIGLPYNINVEPEHCGQKDGEIILVNSQDYTSISLLDTSFNLISNNQSAVFTGLNGTLTTSTFNYQLALTSQQCGTQYLPVSVPRVMPQMSTYLADIGQCPTYMFSYSYIQIQPDFPLNDNDPKIFFNDNNTPVNYNASIFYLVRVDIPNTIRYNNTQTKCQSTIVFNYPQTLDWEVSYTYQHIQACPNAIAQVTLAYNATTYGPVTVRQDDPDNGTLVTFTDGAAATSFVATYGVTYYVRSNLECNLPPFPITLELEHPSITIDDIVKPSCLYTASVNVRNHLLFSSLKLRTDAIPNTVFTPVNGVFRDVPLVSYTLFYSIDNCPTQTLNVDNSQYRMASIDDYTLTYSISRMPQCATGEGEMIIYLNIPQSNNTYSLTMDYLGGEVLDINVAPDNLPNCNVPVLFTAPSDHKLRAPYLLVVQTQPTCKYSKDGQLYIEAKETISKLQIGSSLYSSGQDPAMGGQIYSQVQSGVVPISIFYKYCPIAYTTNLNVTSSSSSFEISVNIANLSTCNTANGMLTVINPASYTQLLLNGQAPSSNGLFSGLAAGDYTLTFTSSSCSGSKIVTIGGPVAPPVDTISIYRHPMCYGNGGVFVSFNSSAVQYSIENLSNQYGLSQVINGQSYFNYLQPGMNSLNIKSGNCNWPLVIDAPSDPRITTGSGKLYSITNVPPMCSFSPGKIIIDPLYDDIVISNIQTNASSQFSPVGNTLLYTTAQPVTITISYSGCTDTIVYQPLGAVQPPEPGYEVINTPCGTDYNVTVQFSNHTYYDMVARIDQGIPVRIDTTTGRIDRIVPGTTIVIQYSLKSTRCSGIIVIKAPVEAGGLLSPLNPDGTQLVKQITKETCYGSRDGSLIIAPSNLQNSYYRLYDQQNNPISPSSIVGGLVTFTQLTSQTYTLTNSYGWNPYCKAGLPIDMTSNEPTLNVLSTTSCGISNGTINSQLLIQNVTGALTSFTNVSFALDPSSTSATAATSGSTSNSAIFGDLQGGLHTVVADIFDPICPRHLITTVRTDQVELIAGANSSDCSTITVTPSIVGRQNGSNGDDESDKFNFKLFNEDGEELSAITKLTTVSYFNLDDGGDYTVVVEHATSGCTVSQVVTVEACPSTEGSRSRVGMITGATLGSIVGAGFLCLGGYLVKQKFTKSKTQARLRFKPNGDI